MCTPRVAEAQRHRPKAAPAGRTNDGRASSMGRGSGDAIHNLPAPANQAPCMIDQLTSFHLGERPPLVRDGVLHLEQTEDLSALPGAERSYLRLEQPDDG